MSEIRMNIDAACHQDNVLRIIAPALSNKVLPVPSALSNKLPPCNDMALRHTVHPEHKKATKIVAFGIYILNKLKIHSELLGCIGHAQPSIDALDS